MLQQRQKIIRKCARARVCERERESQRGEFWNGTITNKRTQDTKWRSLLLSRITTYTIQYLVHQSPYFNLHCLPFNFFQPNPVHPFYTHIGINSCWKCYKQYNFNWNLIKVLGSGRYNTSEKKVHENMRNYQVLAVRNTGPFR